MKNLYILLFTTLIFTSCKKKESAPPAAVPLPVDRVFSNVVVLGNSITRASPAPEIGWNNNWGMAATKAELDYYHLLTAQLQVNNPNVKVNSMPTGEFEVNYTTFDIKYYAELKASKPDLLIMRFGENVVQDSPNLPRFEEKYAALIDYFKDGNPNLKILAVGSFWGNPVVDEAMKKHSKFVSLTPLLSDKSNQAFGQFPNYGVSIHPSDKGMKLIKNIIWDGLIGF